MLLIDFLLPFWWIFDDFFKTFLTALKKGVMNPRIAFNNQQSLLFILKLNFLSVRISRFWLPERWAEKTNEKSSIVEHLPQSKIFELLRAFFLGKRM